jgi:hypothetical protein
MGNTCSTETGCCETEAKGSECCPVQNPNACPTELAAGLWKKAFYEAMFAAHVDVLKDKIRKGWGARLDKTADAVLESMETQWHAALTKAKSDADLKEKIRQSLYEGKK